MRGWCKQRDGSREGSTERMVLTMSPDLECTEEALVRERSGMAHRALRSWRGHKGWGPGGAQAWQTPLATGCAVELWLLPQDGAEEGEVEEGDRRVCEERQWSHRGQPGGDFSHGR